MHFHPPLAVLSGPRPPRWLLRAALLLGFVSAGIARGQGVPAVVLLDPITAGAVGSAGAMIAPLLEQELSHQQSQISAATDLNQSIGPWQGAPVGLGLVSSHLQAAVLTRDETASLRAGVVWDTRPGSPASPVTLQGAAVPVAPADHAVPDRLDQAGAATRESLIVLAREIEDTQTEVASTYAAMTGIGLSQQKYEKLRGKLQALQLHLDDLQAQQHTALDLLQAQAVINGGQTARDTEIAALVQEANHKENVAALAALPFDELSWR